MFNFDLFDLKLKRVAEITKANTDDVIRLLHTYMTPFTAKKKLKSLLPPDESPDFKEITSAGNNKFSEQIPVFFHCTSVNFTNILCWHMLMPFCRMAKSIWYKS